MPRFYLGIDGGQSSTTAMIADERGRVVGCGRGGPCNHVTRDEGRAKFFHAVGDCLSQACAAAGLDPATVQFASACLGFSGGPEDKETYSKQLIRSTNYKITHDAEIALSGATAGEPGIIIISGTGSMAFGRNARGETARAGGWGYAFGDEGGGFDLTRRALRAILQQEEGWGAPTTLRDALLQATGMGSANALLHHFYSDLDRPAIASYSKLVTEAADRADAVAVSIVEAAAASLAWFVGGIYNHLFSTGADVPVAPIGGVFRSEILRSALAEIVRRDLASHLIVPRMSPAAGALLEAMGLDGLDAVLSEVPASEK